MSTTTGPAASAQAAKVVLVTGASSGIGEATALRLAADGHHVVLGARREDRLEKIADAIRSAGGRVSGRRVDVTDRADVVAFADAAVRQHGRIDVIVNNAASFKLHPFDEVTEEEFDDHLAVNVRAPYFLVQAALPALRMSPAPVVVNVSSVAAAMYRPRQTLYGLTKAALEHLTMNLAAELAPDGIRVVCVRPGPVETPIHTQAVDDPAARIAELARLVPLGRLAQPDEVARWIWQLVDREAAWVTGSVITVDGGRILGPPATA